MREHTAESRTFAPLSGWHFGRCRLHAQTAAQVAAALQVAAVRDTGRKRESGQGLLVD